VQSERFRKLKSRWRRDELGAERKAARRKCSKAFAPILDIIRKNAVHAFAEGGGRKHGCGFGWRSGGLRLDRAFEFFMRTLN
jgi:hypothetical protein